MSADADIRIVKELTRQAADMAGGQKRLAPFIRQQRVSDLGNDAKPDIVRVTEAALFDRLTVGRDSGAHFARYLAANIGCTLIALPAPDLPETIWTQRMGALLKEVGDVSSGIGLALATDSGAGDVNDVSPDEAKDLLVEADQLVAAAVEIREALRRRSEGQL